VPHIPVEVPARHIPFEAQQPLGHETPSQTQAPLTQCLPLSQAAPAPQRQAPPAAQVSAVTASQATQLPPADPQAASDGAVQVPLAQHPVGQVCALQTQAPPVHTLPAAHGPGLTPQRQAPVAPSHRSARVSSQARQAWPPVAQVASAGAWHAPSAPQQPTGQDAASHPQAPAAQVRPAPHGGPAPQAHAPSAEQLSATEGSQDRQAAPASPQVPAVRPEQVEPEQQPVGQLAASHPAPAHTPPAQALPPQFWQLAPPLPQLVGLLPGWHEVPLQHPPGQDVTSHTHAPARHLCPAAHGEPVAPQRHPPGARQRSAVMPQLMHAPPPEPQAASDAVWQTPPAQQPPAHEVASHTQAPPTQCWPAAQVAPAPHWHAPEDEQWSLRTGSQATQPCPPVPHCPEDGEVQAVPAQQPLGHEVASQTQAPERQRCPSAQGGPVPQAQAPAGEQPSALVTSQLTHSAPADPQLDTLDGLQVAPAQQPSGQVVALQPLQRPAVQV
jgi:hypothetical protein